jgi:hypothetical protein
MLHACDHFLAAASPLSFSDEQTAGRIGGSAIPCLHSAYSI